MGWLLLDVVLVDVAIVALAGLAAWVYLQLRAFQRDLADTGASIGRAAEGLRTALEPLQARSAAEGARAGGETT